MLNKLIGVLQVASQAPTTVQHAAACKQDSIHDWEFRDHDWPAKGHACRI